MNLEEICPIASAHSINVGKYIKIELIKALQTEDGNFDCFGSAHNCVCDQVGCFWREGCFAAAREN